MRRVVVTGLGTLNPCANDVRGTWDAMVRGRSGTARLSKFDPTGLASQIAGEVKGFDGAERFGTKFVRRTGLFTQYALAAGDEAMADAGFDLRQVDLEGSGHGWPDPDRFGTYVGSGIGGFPEIVDEANVVRDSSIKRISPLFIPRSLINLAAGQLAIRFRARGPSLCIATACAVGNHSIGEAWRAIATDAADVIVAGGCEGSITELGFGGFMNMRALSRRNDDPEHASRPFDVDRDGFVMSEGAGLVVLESLEHAQARGARIYCELLGYAATTDAHHITAPAPNGVGAERCMKAAMRIAGVDPSRVDYVNAHGTSTPANDVAECQAIHGALGEAASRVWVSSTKGATGHLLGAAGGVEAVATALAIHEGTVPPTANLENVDPGCRLDCMVGSARERSLDVAISNGFGFGGTNAVLVFAAMR